VVSHQSRLETRHAGVGKVNLLFGFRDWRVQLPVIKKKEVSMSLTNGKNLKWFKRTDSKEDFSLCVKEKQLWGMQAGCTLD